jgi:hypothetical protein
VLVVVTQIQAFVFHAHHSFAASFVFIWKPSARVTQTHRERQKEREFKASVLCSYSWELVKNRRFLFLTVHNQGAIGLPVLETL